MPSPNQEQEPDPDPEQEDPPSRACSNVNAKSAYDWMCYFKARYWEIKGRAYGQGTADAKALANFGDLLDSLPTEQRAEDWLARDRIVTEFLSRTDHKTVGSGWPFCFFATDFRGLSMPSEKRPSPEVRQSFSPPRAQYEVLKPESAEEAAARRKTWAEAGKASRS